MGAKNSSLLDAFSSKSVVSEDQVNKFCEFCDNVELDKNLTLSEIEFDDFRKLVKIEQVFPNGFSTNFSGNPDYTSLKEI